MDQAQFFPHKCGFDSFWIVDHGEPNTSWTEPDSLDSGVLNSLELDSTSTHTLWSLQRILVEGQCPTPDTDN